MKESIFGDLEPVGWCLEGGARAAAWVPVCTRVGEVPKAEDVTAPWQFATIEVVYFCAVKKVNCSTVKRCQN
jgi:hypothetical protein